MARDDGLWCGRLAKCFVLGTWNLLFVSVAAALSSSIET